MERESCSGIMSVPMPDKSSSQAQKAKAAESAAMMEVLVFIAIVSGVVPVCPQGVFFWFLYRDVPVFSGIAFHAVVMHGSKCA